jgi:hypothetical protein
MDFVNDMGVIFVKSPIMWKSQKPNIVISSGAIIVTNILDPFFSYQLEYLGLTFLSLACVSGVYLGW